MMPGSKHQEMMRLLDKIAADKEAVECIAYIVAFKTEFTL
jgi:hypothetical protein